MPRERPGFLFCACPDPGLLRVELDAQIRAAASGSAAVTRQTFWGDEELPPRFWDALTLQGFDPALKILVLRNAYNADASAQIKKICIDNLTRLSRALGSPRPLVFILLCLEGAWEKSQLKLPAAIEKLPCLGFARKQGWWKAIPGLTERTLRDYVDTVAGRLGLRFAPGALDALCAALPPNALAVNSELEKLALRAVGRSGTEGTATLLPEDAALINPTQNFNIFNLLRQIQDGAGAAAWKSVLQENNEELLFPLLGLLQREARLLWQLLAGETPPMNPRDIPARKACAARLGVVGLATLWDAMHEAELAVKTGRKSPAQALDSLLGALTLLFMPGRSR